jgi:hypothetical protein
MSIRGILVLTTIVAALTSFASAASNQPKDFNVTSGKLDKAAGGRYQIRALPARTKVVLPAVKMDEPHTLAVALNGLELTVVTDGVVAWQGTLPNISAAADDGPLGFRSDNAHVVFDYTIGKIQEMK